MKSAVAFLFLAMSCYGEPTWILHPPFGAVGYAPQSGNAEMQLRIALISAKAELAKEKKLRVASENTLVDGNFSQRGTQSSFERIDAVEVVQTYKADNGALYVLVR